MAASSLLSMRPKRLTTLFPLGQPDNTNGLIAWYSAAARGAQDASGYNRNGIVAGAVTIIKPPSGVIAPPAAFNFPTSSASNTITATVASGPALAQFSLAAWVYVSAYPSTSYGPIVTIVSGTSKYAFISLSSNGYPYITLVTVGAIDQTAAVGLGKWVRIVGTYDGTSLRLYKNGALVGGPTAETFAFGSLASITLGLQATSYFSTGYIEDARVYNRPLTAGEIYADYASALVPTPDGALVVPKAPAFSLTSAYGPFALTGKAANAALTMPLGYGAGALTGEAAALSCTRKIAPAYGPFALTGFNLTAALVEPIVGFGAFGLTGEAAALACARKLSFAYGAFALAGETFVSGLTAPLAYGVFALTGEAANAGLTLPLGYGACALSGFLATGALVEPVVGFGAFGLTGEAAALARGSALQIGYGGFELVGKPVAFLIGYPATLAAAYGLFAETGEAAALFKTWALAEDGGAFSLTGEPVSFTITITPTGTAKITWRSQGLAGIVPAPASAMFDWKV